MTKITIELTADVLEATVNGKMYQAKAAEIANAGLVKVLEYGFQRIVNDRCGGSDKTDEDKDTLAKARVADVVSGAVAVRTARASANPLERFVRKVVRSIVMKKGSDELKAQYKDGTAAERNELLDAVFAKQADKMQAKITEKAQTLLDEDIARRAAEAAVANDGEFDLDI